MANLPTPQHLTTAMGPASAYDEPGTDRHRIMVIVASIVCGGLALLIILLLACQYVARKRWVPRKAQRARQAEYDAAATAVLVYVAGLNREERALNNMV
ncbi:hypothetical protein CcaverHIS002_0507650 [Cutaneotrichosporon cavernicola]|nr:hypothetical protein CcaverHIS002_0507650 [Cutaneotrichosporon cavernicola]BEJ00970.1 hypothetical protein CcaverHIS631_0508270 [Cutaneotrichosporon cavernicola]BEJ08735.1 hypothetical protein CcaverHIS641_0508290 [Cutaneotrichosporon cavernicola]